MIFSFLINSDLFLKEKAELLRFVYIFIEQLNENTIVNDKVKLKINKPLNTMKDMFSNCDSLIKVDLSNLKTSNVENMKGMFAGCKKLTYLNISSFS